MIPISGVPEADYCFYYHMRNFVCRRHSITAHYFWCWIFWCRYPCSISIALMVINVKSTKSVQPENRLRCKNYTTSTLKQKNALQILITLVFFDWGKKTQNTSSQRLASCIHQQTAGSPLSQLYIFPFISGAHSSILNIYPFSYKTARLYAVYVCIEWFESSMTADMKNSAHDRPECSLGTEAQSRQRPSTAREKDATRRIRATHCLYYYNYEPIEGTRIQRTHMLNMHSCTSGRACVMCRIVARLNRTYMCAMQCIFSCTHEKPK